MSLENPMMGKVWQKTIFRNSDDLALTRRGHLTADQVRSVEADGVVDTGAAMVVLNQEIVDKLGLQKVAEMTVRYADHRTAKRDVVGHLEIEIQGRRSTYRAVVEPGRKTRSSG
jgi:predicted aspartyl protease